MTVHRNNGAFDTSNVTFAQGVLRKYAKGVQAKEMTHIDYGLSLFKASIFEAYPNDFPIDLSDICTNLSSEGPLAGYEVQERFYEIGSLTGIRDFSEYIERNQNVL